MEVQVLSSALAVQQGLRKVGGGGDYVERAGVRQNAEISMSPTSGRLEGEELEHLWPGGMGSENMTGHRAEKATTP